MATVTQAWRRVARSDQLLLLFLAVAVGAAAVYGALLFRLATAAIQVVFLGHPSERLVSAAAATPWWQLLLAPAVGGLLIGLFTRFVLPGRLPQGVAQVMEASALRQARMSLGEGLGAAFVSAASIGCGASVGREGPIVHLGATLGSSVAKRLRLSLPLGQTLLGCGAGTRSSPGSWPSRASTWRRGATTACCGRGGWPR
jgi:CIC family chloride channel protein